MAIDTQIGNEISSKIEALRPSIIWHGNIPLSGVETFEIPFSGLQNKHDLKILEFLKKIELTKDNPNWFNGVLHTLIGFSVKEDSMIIKVGTVYYSEYITTLWKIDEKFLSEDKNFLELQKKFKLLTLPETTNAIVLNVDIITADGYYLLGERTKATSVSGKDIQLGNFGGTYNKDELTVYDNSLLAQLWQELFEELGITQNPDIQANLKYIINDAKFKDKRVIFLAEVRLPFTLEQVQKLFKSSGNKKEHTEIIGIKLTEENILELLSKDNSALTEALKAALVLRLDELGIR